MMPFCDYEDEKGVEDIVCMWGQGVCELVYFIKYNVFTQVTSYGW